MKVLIIKFKQHYVFWLIVLPISVVIEYIALKYLFLGGIR